jgi:murein DD-endopeptidase MepM/ murein hydrolase activator NlpD
MKPWLKWTALAVPVVAVGYVLIGVDVRPREEYVEEGAVQAVDSTLLPPDAYGIPMSGFVLEKGTVRSGDSFGALLARHGVDATTVQHLVEAAKPHFNVTKIRTSHPYAFIFADDSSRTPAYFIYEEDAVRYLVFDVGAEPSVRVGERPVHTAQREVACAVTGALYNDLQRAGADPALAMQLADVFAWTVDMYRIQKNDTFAVVYEESTVDGKAYGSPKVLAARYLSGASKREAFRYEHSDGRQYFDSEGQSLRKAFLKAPLKFSRISSRFSGRRLHPVQKVMKAHLGTDYAAPYGTPILAVGDGVVEKAGRTGGNGNFVKIRHNGTYSTQYLHMRKILVREGQRVAQGDVIGEVGSTGLATGPHVCFRFWKNGVQVDHLKEEFPSAEPLAREEMPAFLRVRDTLALDLDNALVALREGRVVLF